MKERQWSHLGMAFLPHSAPCDWPVVEVSRIGHLTNSPTASPATHHHTGVNRRKLFRTFSTSLQLPVPHKFEQFLTFLRSSNRFGLNRPPFDRPQLSVFPSPFSLFSRGRWSLSLFKPHLSTFAPECPSALYLFNLLLAVYLECYVIEATKRFNIRSVFLIDKVFACA